jgi:hypothetical protein
MSPRRAALRPPPTLQPGVPSINREFRGLNLGLYLDRPPLDIDPRAMQACRNVRVKQGEVRNQACGWSIFSAPQSSGSPVPCPTLNGPVTMIESFFQRNGSQWLLLGTPSDIYLYNQTPGTVSFLTPIYTLPGGSSVNVVHNSATVTGSGGTTFLSFKAGDQLYVGSAGAVDPTLGWVTILSITNNTTLVLTNPYPGSSATLQPYTVRKTYVGKFTTPWRAATFWNVAGANVDYWYATNGVDAVQRWDGSAAQLVPLTGFPFTSCAEIINFKNMMVYADLVVSGQSNPGQIINSDPGSPETFTTQVSSQLTITNGADTVLGMRQLGDLLNCYGAQNGVYTLYFVGPPLNWVIRPAIRGKGCFSSRSIATFPAYHQYLATDTAYKFDGFSGTPIGIHVFINVLQNFDQSRAPLTIVWVDEANGEILYAIPLTSDPAAATSGPASAWTENYLERMGQGLPQPMAVRDLPVTAIGGFLRQSTTRFSDLVGRTFNSLPPLAFNDRFWSAQFPLVLFGTVGGQVFVLGGADDQNGTAFTAFAQFGRLAASGGQDGNKGMVKRIIPFARQEVMDALNVQVYGADQPAGPSSLVSTSGYDQTQSSGSERFVNPGVVVRYGEVGFMSNGLDEPWRVGGYGVEIVPWGHR